MFKPHALLLETNQGDKHPRMKSHEPQNEQDG